LLLTPLLLFLIVSRPMFHVSPGPPLSAKSPFLFPASLVLRFPTQFNAVLLLPLLQQIFDFPPFFFDRPWMFFLAFFKLEKTPVPHPQYLFVWTLDSSIDPRARHLFQCSGGLQGPLRFYNGVAGADVRTESRLRCNPILGVSIHKPTCINLKVFSFFFFFYYPVCGLSFPDIRFSSTLRGAILFAHSWNSLPQDSSPLLRLDHNQSPPLAQGFAQGLSRGTFQSQQIFPLNPWSFKRF